MDIKTKKENKFFLFIKNFWVYIVAGIIAIGIGVTLGVTAAVKQNQEVVDVVNTESGDSDDGGDHENLSGDNSNKENNNQEENTTNQNDEGNDDKVPASVEPLSFALPMSEASVIVDYSDSKLVYNPTLDRWESHFYVDLTSSDLAVYSILDGNVVSVDYDYLTGYEIKIEHEDGFVSIYSSLGEDVKVEEGDAVKKGQHIANASNLSASSSAYGEHLAFTLLKDNKKIDPNNYLDLQNK